MGRSRGGPGAHLPSVRPGRVSSCLTPGVGVGVEGPVNPAPKASGRQQVLGHFPFLLFGRPGGASPSPGEGGPQPEGQSRAEVGVCWERREPPALPAAPSWWLWHRAAGGGWDACRSSGVPRAWERRQRLRLRVGPQRPGSCPKYGSGRPQRRGADRPGRMALRLPQLCCDPHRALTCGPGCHGPRLAPLCPCGLIPRALPTSLSFHFFQAGEPRPSGWDVGRVGAPGQNRPSTGRAWSRGPGRVGAGRLGTASAPTHVERTHRGRAPAGSSGKEPNRGQTHK